jgi:hypothetical protein
MELQAIRYGIGATTIEPDFDLIKAAMVLYLPPPCRRSCADMDKVLHNCANRLHSHHRHLETCHWTSPIPTRERRQYEDSSNSFGGFNDCRDAMVLSYGLDIWPAMPSTVCGLGRRGGLMPSYSGSRNHWTCTIWYGCHYQLVLCGM